MTASAPEGIETKDVHSQMMSDGDFETKNLPGGYLPAGVPHTDRTGTQKTEAGGDPEATASLADSTTTDAGTDTGSGSGTAASRKSTASKSTTTKS